MRGDSDYSAKHQHGNVSEGKFSEDHLMDRKRHTEPKEIQRVYTPYRGHVQLDFVDGSTMLLERAEYQVVPKAGDFWPKALSPTSTPFASLPEATTPEEENAN
jgi:hypothetical protein